MEKGKLFVVATPIGNLEDITFRAINTLKNVDFIICEDTRVTNILLNKYEIKKELVFVNARNENRMLQSILSRLKEGHSAALVSDAGTPCISDPGTRLINCAIKQKIEIVGIPGANAATLALSISGLPVDSFIFEGFIPQKKGRQKELKKFVEEERCIVFYESVYRIKKLLEELNEYMPERLIIIFRELTKKFEESWRGTVEQLLNTLDKKIIKGEFVVIIAPQNWKENF
ncbi:MAG: 16S rRNA (cytidine(1402)-2'-O)-methyltransferase [Ignavibacteriales bacterium]|nr:16S rRNA (cytidine(1402)-2'-O)-methyltransferase [Ignavibacteriales bacterium]